MEIYIVWQRPVIEDQSCDCGASPHAVRRGVYDGLGAANQGMQLMGLTALSLFYGRVHVVAEYHPYRKEVIIDNLTGVRSNCETQEHFTFYEVWIEKVEVASYDESYDEDWLEWVDAETVLYEFYEPRF